MADNCVKHSFELSKATCRQCHNPYCDECLIYSFGPKKPPYCVTCALNAAGVRRSGATPNPRVRRKGFFGKLQVVEAVVPRERNFDEIDIELPASAMRPTPTRSTRRIASPELVEVVAASEANLPAPPAQDAFPTTAPQVSADEVSLADWAASLGETLERESEAEARSAAPWPENEIAPWPDAPSSGSF